MLRLIVERLASTVVLVTAMSIVAFILIQLPPGDFADSYVNKKAQGGVVFTMEEVDEMRRQLGLDRPFYVQYFDWMGGVLRGDFGFSWEYRRPVSDVIGERLGLTLALAFSTLLFTYLAALQIGILSVVRQY